MPKTLLTESTCRHCGYQWVTKVEQPRKCPDCYRRWPLRQVDPATKAQEVSDGA